MRFKWLRLKNIRSYLDERVDFPSRSLLLAGDVGSGKSSLLVAIEFALFGLLKGMLSGNALLRHGKSEGEVELAFELDGKEIVVKRTLLRTKSKIEQGPGTLVVDGIAQRLTPMQLKSALLDLLGYPKELVTKSKALIYRFTVYTPQEEMRRIVTEENETRLGVLRKVFGIDRYSRLAENAGIYARILRERARQLEGIVAGLDQKRAAETEVLAQLRTTESCLKDLQGKLEHARARAAEAEARLGQLEKELAELSAFRQQLAAVRARQEELERQLAATALELQRLDRERAGLGVQKCEASSASLESELSELESELEALAAKAAELSTLAKEAETISSRLAALETCPVCLQAVGAEHRSKICIEKEKQAAELRAQAKAIEERAAKLKSAQLEVKGKLRLARAAELWAAKVSAVEQARQRLQAQLQGFNSELEKLSRAQAELAAKANVKLELEHARARELAKATLQELNSLQLEERALLERQGMLQKELRALRQEIAEKEAANSELAANQRIRSWLSGFFCSIVAELEKAVLAKVWHEFASHFVHWFRLLIEDELLEASLDDCFAPVLKQNGYDSDVEHLSGGERTALALAYRLALNKVISDVMSGIKTRDIVILDEPTDGFSDAQIEKMAEVLAQLGCGQVIIVSHEPKIESFVDKVYRVVKTGHVSRVIRE